MVFLQNQAVAIDAENINDSEIYSLPEINGEKVKQCHILSPEGPGVITNRPNNSLAPAKQRELAFVEALDKIYPRDELPQLNITDFENSEYTTQKIQAPIDKLRPSQNERLKKYTKKAIKLLKQGQEKPIVIDKRRLYHKRSSQIRCIQKTQLQDDSCD